MTLGLHVRNEARILSEHKREHRVPIWWSLYSLECLLNELTGRPSCISDRDNSQPLPLNVDQDAIPDEESRPDTGVGIQSLFPSSRRGSRCSKGI